MKVEDFWQRFQSGIEVAVANAAPGTLLGVREGFLRYFHDGLDRPIPVAIVSHPEAGGERQGLPYGDRETLALARSHALALRTALGDSYHFYVSSEAGIHGVEVDGEALYFVRNWTVILGPREEAWGGSGSLQLPRRLIAGVAQGDLPMAFPGTRRRGGMIQSITGGLETRRSAVALATMNALSSMFYGILETRPVRRRDFV